MIYIQALNIEKLIENISMLIIEITGMSNEIALATVY